MGYAVFRIGGETMNRLDDYNKIMAFVGELSKAEIFMLLNSLIIAVSDSEDVSVDDTITILREAIKSELSTP